MPAHGATTMLVTALTFLAAASIGDGLPTEPLRPSEPQAAVSDGHNIARRQTTATVDYTIAHSWNQGCTINVQARMSTAVDGWTISLTLAPGMTGVSGIWNANTQSTSNDVIVVTNKGWNRVRSANQVISFGGNLIHSGQCPQIASASINGVDATLSGDIVVAPADIITNSPTTAASVPSDFNYTIRVEWPSGCTVDMQAHIGIPVDGWTIVLTLDSAPTSIQSPWNANLDQGATSGTTIVVHNAQHNQVRAANQLISFGTNLGHSSVCPRLVAATINGSPAELSGDFVGPPTSAAPTTSPSTSPSTSPTTSSPTTSPTTSSPTVSPTTSSPSVSPSLSPSRSPTPSPTPLPTVSPTTTPPSTASPTVSPTEEADTSSPTQSPVARPSLSPVVSPTVSPTPVAPTQSPNPAPTPAPAAPTSTGATVTYSIMNTWDSGCTMAIDGRFDFSVSSWSMSLIFLPDPTSIQLWNAEEISFTNGLLRVSDKGYNSNVAAGAGMTFGGNFGHSGECPRLIAAYINGVPAVVQGDIATFSPTASSAPTAPTTQAPTTLSPTQAPSIYPLGLPVGTAPLPVSASGELLKLVSGGDCSVRAPNDFDVGSARSYDGNPWESVQPQPLAVTCVSGSCTVDIPNDGETYCVKDYSTVLVPSSTSAAAARLLSQATFGATEASIAHFESAAGLNNDPAAFLAEQFAEPATEFRQYLRARSSSKQLANDDYGSLRSACDPGSRWHRHALQFLDVGRTLTVVADGVTPGFFALSLDGVLVTEVATFAPGADTYTVCAVEEWRGSTGDAASISRNTDCSGLIAINNPPISFETANAAALDFSSVGLTQHATRSDVVFVTGPTPACTDNLFDTNTFMCTATACYRHDPRVKVITNSLVSPATSGNGDGTCPAVPKSFLNEGACIKSTTCVQPTYSSAQVTLDEATLRAWYVDSNVYVYYVTGLRLEDPYDRSPCVTGTSRWLRTSGTCSSPTAGIDTATLGTIQAALSASTDTNPHVRDITLTGANCVDSNSETVGAQIQVGSECFEHVHPHLYDVRDFSTWVVIHDGNPSAAAGNRPNPIAKWAASNLTYINFPGNHPLTRWNLRNVYMPAAGRLGDTVDFTSLDTDLQTLEMATRVGAAVAAGTQGYETCGSPGEIANDPSLGSWYNVPRPSTGEFQREQLDYPLESESGKSTLWANIVFSAADQLRQRTAWVLSQIVVTADSIGRAEENEPWAAYYDIFVRHAFGNYGDILREISFSPIMGDYLTYRQNKAYAFSGNFPDENFAREIMQLFSVGLVDVTPDGQPILGSDGEPIDAYTNEEIVAFARVWTGFDRQSRRGNVEQVDGVNSDNVIDPMQIKADWRDRLPKHKLQSGYLGDGYPLCHDLPAQDFLREGSVFELSGASSIEGETIDAMTALPDEVIQAETGTTTSATVSPSGWVEFSDTPGGQVDLTVTRTTAGTVDLRVYYYHAGADTTLQVEVNSVVVQASLALPTTGSDDRLGSTSAVSVSLNAGTNTIRLVSTGATGANVDFVAFGGDGAIRSRLELASTSPLYQELCAPVSGTCTFPITVTLGANLVCNGAECSAGRVMTVAVVDPSTGLRQYYTHRPRPCVNLALFNNGQVTQREDKFQCTPPAAPASVACCATGTSTPLPVDILAGDCLFANEAVPFATAATRCAARGGSVCSTHPANTYFQASCAEDTFVWTTATCNPQVQVYADGYIGLVDPVTTDTVYNWEYMVSSGNTFRVLWDDMANFPTPAGGCGAGCTVATTTDGDTCLCDVTVTETVPFADPTEVTVDAIESTLFIGSIPPSAYGAGVYEACTTCPSGVTVWTLVSDNSAYTRHTIFELQPFRAGGAIRYLMNQAVSVSAGGSTFRNPPGFMPALGEQTVPFQAYLSADLLKYEAQYETDALITHLAEHGNTGPFVCKRLIQQMVTSNPSPGYIEAVVNAFTTGNFGTFGNGRYGSIEAAVAATLLHSEARSPILDADPTFGHGIEPLLKLIATLRALEWQPAHGQQLTLLNTEASIGMEAFNAPSVFGYYLPEYASPGAVADARVKAPELQLGQTPFIIRYLNGMVSLIDSGLSSCNDGFGSRCDSFAQVLGYQGGLQWDPQSTDPATVVDKLALLLTQGRLHPALRTEIGLAYANEAASTGSTDAALRLAEKLILISPDFHVSSLNTLNRLPQPASSNAAAGGRAFKAIVVLFMAGGCDSFNLLVPHSNCVNGDGSGSSAPAGSHAEYTAVRTDGAIPQAELLQVSSPAGDQPCDTYGVNNDLMAYKQLYDAGEGAFVANIGALVEPVTKADYQGTSGVQKQFPPSLFAHNAQQRALASVHAQNQEAQGVLARTVTSLLEQDNPPKAELYSMQGNQDILSGTEQGYTIINGGSAGIDVETFNQYDELNAHITAMTANQSDSVFADTYSKLVRESLRTTEALGGQLSSVQLDTDFRDDLVSRQFETIARLIKLRTVLETERAVFVVQEHGFDTHGTWNLSPMFVDINDGLSSFVQEMKAQDAWDDVVFFTVSDFGRTLTSNGQGSDHAWGGNHFIAGGSINGGRILGDFPDSLASDGDLNIGRGRLIPTIGWEYAWSGICEWFGVAQEDMATVLPNLNNFGVSQRTDSVSNQNLFVDRSGLPTKWFVHWAIPPSTTTLTVSVGDTVTFTWFGFHDIWLLTNNQCDFNGATELAGQASSGTYDFVPAFPGVFNFGCSVGPHCIIGMTMTITVEA